MTGPLRRAAALVLALTLAGVTAACSQASPPPTHSPSATPAYISPSPEPSVTPSVSATPRVSALSRAVEDLERGARPRHERLPVFRRPNPDAPLERTLSARNPMDQVLVFLVTDTVAREDGRWFQILLPRRPNGSEGWVPQDSVSLVRLHERIEVDLSAYTLTRYRDGRRIARYRVGVGQPQWPTPTGTFYVWAQVPQPNPAGPYGAYALGLSGFSPVLTDWPGGGRFAIHGTTNRWDTGRKVSHGCIRVFNPQVKRLRNVDMGTPVIVTR